MGLSMISSGVAFWSNSFLDVKPVLPFILELEASGFPLISLAFSEFSFESIEI